MSNDDFLTACVWRINGNSKIPLRMTAGSVGYDICANDRYILLPGDFAIIKTGLIVRPPDGYYFEMFLRSSIPKKRGLLIPHGAGIIDRDYCGENDELGLPVYKFSYGSDDVFRMADDMGNDNPFSSLTIIEPGDRIAQLILRKYVEFDFCDVTGHPFHDSRGGFGSTDTK